MLDPELDEPITDLGFVRSVEVDGDGDVEVHLRLPTSFCSPNFAYLMASDAKDALRRCRGRGTSSSSSTTTTTPTSSTPGSPPTPATGARSATRPSTSLDELRATFRRKAHTAAVERCLTALLRADPDRPGGRSATVALGDLPPDARPRRCCGAGRRSASRPTPTPLVLVDHTAGYAARRVPMALRRARSTRISIDGNAHFCRGLLRTRYPGSGDDQAAARRGRRAGRPDRPRPHPPDCEGAP